MPPSTYKYGCDSTYFLVSFACAFVFYTTQISLVFMVKRAKSTIFEWKREREFAINEIRLDEMNGVDVNQLRYVYLDACNILSDYSTFVITSWALLFVYFGYDCHTMSCAITRYLLLSAPSFMMCSNNVQITVPIFYVFRESFCHFSISSICHLDTHIHTH